VYVFASKSSELGVRVCMLPVAGGQTDARDSEAQCTHSLGLGYKLCAVIPVAGQRTYGTIFRALKVISRVAAAGAESAVYDCLVYSLQCTGCAFITMSAVV